VADVSAECVIGVDLGGTKAIGAAVDEDLAVRYRARRDVPTDDLVALLEMITGLVAEVSDAIGGEVEAVGFGIPCLIDHDRGLAASSVHLPINGIAFAEMMSERLGLPAFMDNDANLSLLGEHRGGAARGHRNAVMLTIGTGIGGAILIDGKLYRGSQGAAGELGHVVVSPDGPDCGPGCPSRGCLESVASGTALVREALRVAQHRPHTRLGKVLAGGREITGPLVTELAYDGDPDAIAVLTSIGEWLGIGLAAIVNIFNPDVVVIGGGVIGAGEMLLAPARRVMAERALALGVEHVQIVAAQHGAEAGALGSAIFARESLDERVRT
jgi:glucokinase